MSATLNSTKFKWIGDEIECCDPQLKKRNRTFYRSCTFNNQKYDVGDYAIVEKGSRKMQRKVCKILCMFVSHETGYKRDRFYGSVRWYIWTRNLNIADYGQYSFPQTNEVVEDLTKVELIDLEQLSQKCYVFFAMPDDSEYLNSRFGDLYFPCRFKITDLALKPIISESISPTLLEAIECVHLTPHRKKSNSDYKEMTEETIVIMRDDCLDPTVTPSKTRVEPVSKTSSGKLRDEKKLHSTPHRKVCFKRNLNESFVQHSQESSPLLNYSLIDQSEGEDKTIKLKLRVSSKQTPNNKNVMKNKEVQLNKIDCNGVSECDIIKLRKSQRLSSCLTPSRKSTRVIKRVSYADYTSPVKKSPSKRGRSISTNSECSTSSYNTTKNTPKKVAKKTEENSVDEDCKDDDYSKEKMGSPLKRNRTISTSNESIPSLSLNNVKKDYISRCVVKLQNCASPIKNDFINISSPKKVRRGTPSKTDVSRYINDLLRNEEISPIKRFPQQITDAVFSDLLKTTVCKVEQLDVHLDEVLTPKKSSKREEDNCVNSATKKMKTPRAKMKLLREGLITPSIQARSTPIKANTTPLNKARTQLHVSYVPNALPCREIEFSDIFNFIEGKLLDKCGGCMYVSGVPGTGKTATVTEVIKQLQALAKTNDIPSFRYVNLNGMKLTEPRQSYVEILKQLIGKTLSWEQAQNTLDVKFTKAQKKSEPIVLVVDELDILCTKRQDVVYNLLDWPSRANMPLIIITIANTMDLPERLLMGRVTSRLGLTRLTFQAYTHKQLQEIVTKRLMGTNAFNPDAIQLVARKVASVSGDARRALDICRRAAEIAELENSYALVSMSHVNEALNAMITQPKVKAIRQCTRLQQLILQALVSEVERTGVEETTFSDVLTMLFSVASLDGFQMVTSTVALRAVSSLGACRLLLLDQKTNDVHQKMVLNVSPDDVYYALRKD